MSIYSTKCILVVISSPKAPLMPEEKPNLPSKENGQNDLTKGFSLTPTLTKLLSPTADLLGLEIRDRVKEQIDKLKSRKRNENLEQHIQDASAQTDKDGIKAIDQYDLFQDWL